MSQTIRVERDIEIGGAALYQPNIKGGILMHEYKIFDETFMGDASEHDWDEQESHGTTITHAAVDGGAETITAAGSAAAECGELSHTAQWSAASRVGVEIKMKVSQITEVCVCGGLVDAKEATDDHVAGELDSAAALRDPTVTADAALFIFDTDNAVATAWYVAALDSDTPGTPVVAQGSVAPVANTYFKIRIQTDPDGNVTFYYNGNPVGFLGTAIGELSTELLTPYVGFISRGTAAALVTVSRITTWQTN